MITFVYLYVLLLSLTMISAIDVFLKHISFWKAFWQNISEMPFVQASMTYVGVFGIVICILEDIQRYFKKNKATQSESKSKESNRQ